MSGEVLVAILREFGALSLLAFGGANSVLPEMHRRAVEVHGWLTSETFSQLYGLAQAAPGPNILVVCLIGWQVAGLAGAAAALAAICAPAALVAYAVSHVWHGQRSGKWRAMFATALLPVTLGLTLASAYLLTAGAATGPVAGGLIALTAGLALWGRVHPLWCIAAGALLGHVGLI